MARPLRELCSTLRRCVRGRLGWLGGPNRATAHHCSAGTGVIGDLFGIRYAEDLAGLSIPAILERAGMSASYATEIRKGTREEFDDLRVAGGRTEIGEEATALALGWAEYLRSHADRIYSSGNTRIEDGARLIIERRNQLPEEFTVRDRHQKEWAGLTDHPAVTSALDLLVANHWCREIDPLSSGGRQPVVATGGTLGHGSCDMGRWLEALKKHANPPGPTSQNPTGFLIITLGTCRFARVPVAHHKSDPSSPTARPFPQRHDPRPCITVQSCCASFRRNRRRNRAIDCVE
jgi:hypothetical protein